MSPPDDELPPGPFCVLETGQRLSASLLWDLQRSFFEQQGARAWSEGIVPQYITSNPWIVNAYARVVLGWLRDCAGPRVLPRASFPPLDLEHPVHIVELGCGSGRFGYLFLHRLRDLLARSPLAQVKIRYILTDFTASTLEPLYAHPALQGFVAQGALDFALYDAGKDQEIRLQHSGEVLSAETLRNPLIVLANYVFDGIPQDAFTIRNGKLFEVRPIVMAPLPASGTVDLADSGLLDRLQIELAETPAAEAPYGDPELDRILREYTEGLNATTLLFPCAAIRCVRNLARLSGDRLLLLSGDKGHGQEELLDGQEAPGITVHGSFSLAVNYHALGQWLLHRDGTFLATTHLSSSLSIVAGLLGEPPGGTVETRLAFDEAIERMGPDDFFDLKKSIEKEHDHLTLEQILAWLRFSGWDSSLLLRCFPTLMKLARSAPDLLREEIHRMVDAVWTTHFPIREPVDLAFHLGVLLCEIERYEAALPFFHESAALYGPNPATVFNLGLCLFHQGDLEAARACVEKAIEEAPDYAPAAALREEIAVALAAR